MNRRIMCLILSNVEDDFTAFWEMYSILKQYFPNESEDEIIEKMYDNMMYLSNHSMIQYYKMDYHNGFTFPAPGEEIIDRDFLLTKIFLKEHVNDWQRHDYVEEVRFLLTAEGLNFLVNQCHNKDFEKSDSSFDE